MSGIEHHTPPGGGYNPQDIAQLTQILGKESTGPIKKIQQELVDSLASGTLTSAELESLKQQATSAMSDPTLPAADQKVIKEFIAKINQTLKDFTDVSKLSQVLAGSSSPEVQNIDTTLNSLISSGTLTRDDLTSLKEQAMKALQDPSLPATDITKLSAFINKVDMMLKSSSLFKQDSVHDIQAKLINALASGTLDNKELAALKKEAAQAMGDPNLPATDQKKLGELIEKINQMLSDNAKPTNEQTKQLLKIMHGPKSESVHDIQQKLINSMANGTLDNKELAALKKEAAQAQGDPNLPATEQKKLGDLIKEIDQILSNQSGGDGGPPSKVSQDVAQLIQIIQGIKSPTPAVQEIQQKLTDALLAGTIDNKELSALKAEVAQAQGDPKMPAADKQKLKVLMDKINEMLSPPPSKDTTPSPPPGTASHHKVTGPTNPFLQVNAVVELYIISNILAKLYIKMMRQDSLLSQKLQTANISMAKDAYNQGIISGQMQAASFMADAQAAGMKLGLAIAKMGILGASEGLTAYKQYNAGKKMGADPNASQGDIQRSKDVASQEVQQMTAFANAALDAGSSAVDHTVAVQKAAAILAQTQADSTKQFIQQISSMLESSIKKLDDDGQSAEQALHKIWDLVKAQQDVSTRQWSS